MEHERPPIRIAERNQRNQFLKRDS